MAVRPEEICGQVRQGVAASSTSRTGARIGAGIGVLVSISGCLSPDLIGYAECVGMIALTTALGRWWGHRVATERVKQEVAVERGISLGEVNLAWDPHDRLTIGPAVRGLVRER